MKYCQDLKTRVDIRERALVHNAKEFKKLIGTAVKLMAVVKANAYGHGIAACAKILAQSANPKIQKPKPKILDLWFGVDSISEALELKKAGIEAPILVLGYIPLARIKETVENNFRIVVYNEDAIRILGRIGQNKKAKIKNKKRKPKNIKIHLKIETGANRQGIKIEYLPEFVKLIKKYPEINVEGVYSHFADTENPRSKFYKKQLDVFYKAVEILNQNGIHPEIRHIASTAATILYPETRLDMVRVGLGIYGLSPFPKLQITNHKSQTKNKLQNTNYKIKINLMPALTWNTRIAQIKNVKKGQAVGYGLSERVKKDSVIAVLPVGYWDGYDRGLSNIGEVLIRGKRCRVLGRVCMNMMMIDITKSQNTNHKSQTKHKSQNTNYNQLLEEEVVLIGKQGGEEITADEIAKKIGTINYEVVTRINPLITRIMQRGKTSLRKV